MLRASATTSALFTAMRALAVRFTTLPRLAGWLADVELRQWLRGYVAAQQLHDVLEER
jgi:hypothetical protein